MPTRKTRAAKKAQAESSKAETETPPQPPLAVSEPGPSHPSDPADTAPASTEATTSEETKVTAPSEESGSQTVSKPKGKSRAARHQPLMPEAVAASETDAEVDETVDTSQPDEVPSTNDASASEESSTTAASTSSRPTMQDRQAKLAELRAKMAASSKANRKDILSEQSRSRAVAAQAGKPVVSRKLQKAEKLLEERDLRQAGEDVERHRNMNYSIEDSERWDTKLEEKDRRRDKGPEDFGDAAARAYQRKLGQIKPDLVAYRQLRDGAASAHANSPASSALVLSGNGRRGKGKQNPTSLDHHHVQTNPTNSQQTDTIHYGSHTPSDSAIDRVITHLNHESEIVKSRSRPRPDDPDTDITYINDKNKHYNKKLKRFFDSQTKEIRENLERGTAL
ncbi:SYF2-domain-containing protein [Testicularia cyperi]|uniref:Pre-mRNA-splicing factor SYF2 n=1 Tax=Testicularia cyperi TaxID=1882483 RepID=A0A317XX12_9BASI|nr:SYF2-domain-containing protein [Testicularia cyperi]